MLLFDFEHLVVYKSHQLQRTIAKISPGGDVAVYVSASQPSLTTPFDSVLVSISVFMTLPTVFHSINPPNNSPLSHSVIPVLFKNNH